jgi:hypothetical protein
MSADRIELRTDLARLSSGDYVALQVEAGPRRREFVVATAAEARRGWIAVDGRPRFSGIHSAFDLAHRLASGARLQAAA